MSDSLKVFGSESTFRRDLRSRLKAGRVDLAGHLEAAREQVDAVPPPPPNEGGIAAALRQAAPNDQLRSVEERIDRWSYGNRRVVTRFLGSAMAERLVPVGFDAPVSERRDLGARVQRCERTLIGGLDALESILDSLPSTASTAIRQPDDRFAELRQTELIDPPMLASYLRRMSMTRTVAQRSEAIGAAKELVEAANRATLDRVGVPYPTDDFAKLGKLVRKEVLQREAATPSQTSRNAIDQLFAGMATVERALSTLRNELGTGHGKPNLPDGLKARHAQLAIDIADTHVRYLVATLVDLKLL